MLWEELTLKDFSDYVEKSDGVCILPMGVLEKHGEHLPLGTDMYQVRAVAKAAADISPAVIFPFYFLGQIAEALHVKGTIAASHKLLMDALLEMCDEIHRNGFCKILLLNGHGGNLSFLPFFLQMFPGLNRPYAVYHHFILNLPDESNAIFDSIDLGLHAGFSETSLMLYHNPELVHMDRVKLEETKSLDRLKGIVDEDVFTGFNWYANYPNHIAGDPTQATAEYGKILFEMQCDKVVKVLQEIKKDEASLKIIKEYNDSAFPK